MEDKSCFPFQQLFQPARFCGYCLLEVLVDKPHHFCVLCLRGKNNNLFFYHKLLLPEISAEFLTMLDVRVYIAICVLTYE